uniref:Si:cabz01036006.1 n=1 Tax=Sinocyclocheilus grahami TaxID=75366 RepID=A0A672MYW6_SINGR
MWRGMCCVRNHVEVKSEKEVIRGVQWRNQYMISVVKRPKPVVTVTPDQRVFRGETVTLTCDIQGGGNFQWTYSWFKDASVIRHVTERVYTITSVSDNSGEYSCRGERSDSQRSDTSAAVTLTVSGEYLNPKPELMSDSAGAALTGNTVTLTCRMNLSPEWDFYWYKHTLNSETKKKKTNSYRVKIDSVSDGGQYWCRAGRGEPVYYTQYSDALWVNVTDLPRPTLTVTPDSVFAGERVSLKCVINSDHRDWRYEWYKYRTDVSKRNTGNILTIERSETSDAGQYTCKGHIDGRSVSSHSSFAVYLSVKGEFNIIFIILLNYVNDKCRALILSMGHHTWPHVTSLKKRAKPVVKVRPDQISVCSEERQSLSL